MANKAASLRVCVYICVCECEFIREGRGTHAVRRASALECASACATTLPSLDQMFFTWEPDHHLTGVSLVLQPHTRSSVLLGGLPAVPHFDPRPGALVLGESGSGPSGRWSVLDLAILLEEIIRDIIRVWVPG